MRVTTKGQVTIPQEIREYLGLLPNTEVLFVREEGVVYLKKADAEKPTSRGDKIVERLRGSATTKLSTEDIIALMRGEAAEV